MTRARRALFALVLLSSTALPAHAGLEEARARLLQGDFSGAVLSYSGIRTTHDPERAAEYAYALALAGFDDLALSRLDQAGILLNKNRPEKNGTVNFFAAQVFALLGDDDIAGELALQSAPRPAWMAGAVPPPRSSPAPRRPSAFSADMAVANNLLVQKRYYTAARRFQRMGGSYPREPEVHA
ncbi:MAG TPA: hypothetical protein P5079_09810, partial [Elusimicrobiota bacterium]|nr:hypothetical protein [Elusimicrobiota bacterium]